MKFQLTFTRAGIRYFLLAMVFGLLNCTVDYIGTTVPENQRIPLQKGGRQSAVSNAFEYTMDFNYLFYQEDIERPGNIDMSGTIKSKGGGLETLSIWVNFLDAQGTILLRKNVYFSGSPGSDRRRDRSFSVKLETPPGAAAVSFTHSGQRRRNRSRK